MSKARQLAQKPTQPTGRKNLIINGAMTVAQRGSAATVNAGTYYGEVDRYAGYGISGGQFTLGQSTAAPDGFNYSNIATVTVADTSIASGDYYGFVQRIEGYNMAHLGFGSSSAKTVTLSFWVRSSVTGTFGGAFRNSAANRTFIFSYTIDTANTWEYKTVTVAGDTSGTWLTTNGTGIILGWSLGDGSSRLNTAGSWVAGNYAGVTGQTNLIETSGATWQITGIQLEAGSVATEFEHRSFGEELALCQRYYTKFSFPQTTSFFPSHRQTTNTVRSTVTTPVPMRTLPSINGSGQPYIRYHYDDSTSFLVDSGNSLTVISSSLDGNRFTINNGSVTGVGVNVGAVSAYNGYLECNAEL